MGPSPKQKVRHSTASLTTLCYRSGAFIVYQFYVSATIPLLNNKYEKYNTPNIIGYTDMAWQTSQGNVEPLQQPIVPKSNKITISEKILGLLHTRSEKGSYYSSWWLQMNICSIQLFISHTSTSNWQHKTSVIGLNCSVLYYSAIKTKAT